MRVLIRLLGELVVMLDGASIEIPAYRACSLLAALLLRPQVEHRERLVALLYPDLPEARGRRRLSHALWQLCRWLPELPIESDAEAIHLLRDDLWVDIEAFQRAASSDHLDDWLAALTLYCGDLLEGFYDDWLIEEREALYLQYVSVAQRATERLLREHRFTDLFPVIERLVQQEPYDEHAFRQLMRAYRAVGRRGAALVAYNRLVQPRPLRVPARQPSRAGACGH